LKLESIITEMFKSSTTSKIVSATQNLEVTIPSYQVSISGANISEDANTFSGVNSWNDAN
jgi:hypothetical protein